MTYIWKDYNFVLIFCDPVDTFKHTMILQHNFMMINKTASSTSQNWGQVSTTMMYPAPTNPLLARKFLLHNKSLLFIKTN